MNRDLKKQGSGLALLPFLIFIVIFFLKLICFLNRQFFI